MSTNDPTTSFKKFYKSMRDMIKSPERQKKSSKDSSEGNSDQYATNIIRKSDLVENSEMNLDLTLMENEFSSFVIVEGGRKETLSESDWRQIIANQSISGFDIKDIHESLSVGIPFLM